MVCGLIKHFFVCLFVPLSQVWKDDWIFSNKRPCVWLSSLHWGSIVMLLGHRIFIKFFFPFVGRMVFGYAYPAYECYKAVEKNKPEIQQLRFWCQYWFVICLFFSRLFLSWAFSFLKVKSYLPLKTSLQDFGGCFDHFRKSWRYFCFLVSVIDNRNTFRRTEMYILMLFLSCFREGFRSTARQSWLFSYIFGSPRPE